MAARLGIEGGAEEEHRVRILYADGAGFRCLVRSRRSRQGCGDGSASAITCTTPPRQGARSGGSMSSKRAVGMRDVSSIDLGVRVARSQDICKSVRAMRLPGLRVRYWYRVGTPGRKVIGVGSR